MRTLTRELIETLILALSIFLVLQFSVQNFRVEGSSMQPTLKQGQYLLVNKLVYMRVDSKIVERLLPFVDLEGRQDVFPFRSPERGDVLIFRFPRDESLDFVKRVIGTPGDEVEIRRGTVYVNGVELEEPYVTYADRQSMPLIEVPPGHYFVMGDNRRASNDSRDWGPVPSDKIIGQAWLSYWPMDQWGTLQSPLPR